MKVDDKPVTFDWNILDLTKLEARLIASVPEGRNAKEWFEEQYMTKPIPFEPDRS